MPIDPQPFDLHVSKTYDIAGSAQDADGNPVALTSLAFTPADGPVGTAEVDPDPTDDNDGLATADTVGATDTLTFTADGADGKKYEAVALITLVAQEAQIQPMNLTFTERA